MSKITIDLESRTAGFINGVDKAGDSVHRLGVKVEETDSLLGKFTEGLGIGSGVEAFTKGFELIEGGIDQVKEGFEEVGEIGRNALKLGIASDEMSRFQYAANATHTDIGALTSGMDKLNISIGKVASGDAGAKAAADSLKALGLDAKELEGMDPGEVFKRVSAAVAGMTDTFARANIVRELFGRGGRELLPLMGELNEKMAESDRTGFTRTAADVKVMTEEEEQLVAMTASFKGLLMDIATSDWAQQTIASITSVGEAFAQKLGGDAIGKSIDATIAKINALTPQIEAATKQSTDADFGDQITESLDSQIAREKDLIKLIQEQAAASKQLDDQVAAAGGTRDGAEETNAFIAKRLEIEQGVVKALEDQKAAADAASKSISDANAKAAGEVAQAAKMVGKLKEEAATAGMGPEAKDLYSIQQSIDELTKLKDAGKATEEQIQSLGRLKLSFAEGSDLGKEIEQLNTHKRVLEEIDRLDEQRAAALAGKNGAASAKFAGAIADDQAALEKHAHAAADAEAYAKDAEKVKEMWKEAETPLQKYQDQLAEIKRLADEHLLTLAQVAQLKLHAKEELNKEEKVKAHEPELNRRQFDFRLPAGGKADDAPKGILQTLAREEYMRLEAYKYFQNQNQVAATPPNVYDVQ